MCDDGRVFGGVMARMVPDGELATELPKMLDLLGSLYPMKGRSIW